MSLNESIVEDAALKLFEELGDSIGHESQLAPGEPVAESACASHADRRGSFPEVVQPRGARTLIPSFSQREKGKDCEATRRLNPLVFYR